MLHLDIANVVRELSGDGGSSLEELWQTLVRRDAVRCGLSAAQVHWDYRSSVPDGGRDLKVDAGNNGHAGTLIPSGPSLWSFKSGADGTKPSTLATEVRDQSHPTILQLLKSGGYYVWCPLQPTTIKVREEFEKKAQELAADLGFPQGRILFQFNDHLCSAIQQTPTVIPAYLPGIASRLGPWLSITQWQRKHSKTTWVDFESRSILVKRIREHLLGTAQPNVLHLGGLSGVGKSRLVLEACSDPTVADQVVYYESEDEFTSKVLPEMRTDDQVRGAAVVDEVTLEGWERIRDDLKHAPDRIRIVTIGPALRDQRPAEPQGFLMLPEPQDHSSIVAVLRSGALPTTDQSTLNVIAESCNQDLRFGMLLLEGIEATPGLATSRIAASEALANPLGRYHQVLRHHRVDLENHPTFRDNYPYLTLTASLGVEGEFRPELEFVATTCGVDAPELDALIVVASKCGLGQCTRRFFEPVPRGLAGIIFEQILWPRIRAQVKSIVSTMPSDRLRTAFHSRIALCSGHIRQEVGEAIRSYFLGQLPNGDLAALADPGLARSFRLWCELLPGTFLGWLRGVITSAKQEQLHVLSGATGVFGPTGGRREIVWLCVHLGCFSEYFVDCEDILFHLALAENEPIGNNATAEWKTKFSPLLSNTELEFGRRCEILVNRIREMTTRTAPLVLSGLSEALEPRLAVMSPPKIVGGRVVPPEWRPASGHELHAALSNLIRDALQALRTLPSGLQSKARDVAIGSISNFLKLDTREELREFLETAQLADVQRRSLLSELVRHQARTAKDQGASADQLRVYVEEWIEHARPQGVEERLKYVIGRAAWEHRIEVKNQMAQYDWLAPYRTLATDVLESHESLATWAGWLSSPEAKSAGAFGFALAQADTAGKCAPVIEQWIMNRQCEECVAGYLEGLPRVGQVLPEWMSEVLDHLVDSSPQWAAQLSAHSDWSRRGLERIHRALAKGVADVAAILGRMFGQQWNLVLTPADQAALLGRLMSPGPEPSRQSRAALHLLTMWMYGKKGGLPPELLEDVIRVVVSPPVGQPGQWQHEWADATRMVMYARPGQFAEQLAGYMLDASGRDYELSRESITLLKELASQHPDEVMSAIGSRALKQPTRSLFFVLVFRGLFEGIGELTVRPWVEKHGKTAALAIARHVQSPYVSQNDEPVVPALTYWLLDRYGADDRVFREFMAGRHSFEVRSGHARDREKEVRSTATAFLNHKLDAVRKWAELEIAEIEHELERDEIEEEERDKF